MFHDESFIFFSCNYLVTDNISNILHRGLKICFFLPLIQIWYLVYIFFFSRKICLFRMWKTKSCVSNRVFFISVATIFFYLTNWIWFKIYKIFSQFFEYENNISFAKKSRKKKPKTIFENQRSAKEMIYYNLFWHACFFFASCSCSIDN